MMCVADFMDTSKFLNVRFSIDMTFRIGLILIFTFYICILHFDI